MYVVTGGLGFIGSNLIKALNARGIKDIVNVDYPEKLEESFWLDGLIFDELLSPDEFLSEFKQTNQGIDGIFHNGACTDTTEWNGELMMQQNYLYSKSLLDVCVTKSIPLVYASSASVYGASHNNCDNQDLNDLRPLNVYGFSKLFFDEYVQALLGSAQPMPKVIGLRYFNVYGPGEFKKAKMASVAFHFIEQLKNNLTINLFKGSHGFADGEQLRDFVYVNDIIDMNIWAMFQADYSGVFNAGSGEARSFNDVANILIQLMGEGEKNYIEFPESLLDAYQSYTCATKEKIHQAGYRVKPTTLEQGLEDYFNFMNERK